MSITRPTKDVAQVVAVQGSGSKPYTVEIFTDGTSYCTCPGWRFKKGVPADERECKHTTKVRASHGWTKVVS